MKDQDEVGIGMGTDSAVHVGTGPNTFQNLFTFSQCPVSTHSITLTNAHTSAPCCLLHNAGKPHE